MQFLLLWHGPCSRCHACFCEITWTFYQARRSKVEKVVQTSFGFLDVLTSTKPTGAIYSTYNSWHCCIIDYCASRKMVDNLLSKVSQQLHERASVEACWETENLDSHGEDTCKFSSSFRGGLETCWHRGKPRRQGEFNYQEYLATLDNIYAWGICQNLFNPIATQTWRIQSPGDAITLFNIAGSQDLFDRQLSKIFSRLRIPTAIEVPRSFKFVVESNTSCLRYAGLNRTPFLCRHQVCLSGYTRYQKNTCHNEIES